MSVKIMLECLDFTICHLPWFLTYHQKVPYTLRKVGRFKKGENGFFSSTDPEDAKLNASSGSFASPRYQGPSSLLYANNFRATISISIPGDFGIIFTFSEFDLETKYNGKCLDYLEVRLCVTQ